MTRPTLFDSASFAPLTPIDHLRRAAVVHGSRPAVVDGPARLTYAELLEECMRQAGALAGLGVRPGDRVAVLAPNSSLLLKAHYSVPMAGAVLVALNTRLAGPELAAIVAHSGARFAIVDETLLEKVSDLAVPVYSEGAFAALAQSAPPLMIPVTDERSLVSMNYTSGTTGRPKGVMYPHRGAYLQSVAMAFHMGLGTDSVYLWTLPMFHCNGWTFPWAVVAAGGTQVCSRKVLPSETWRLIREEGVNALCAAPIVLGDLARAPEAAPLTTRVTVATGGSPPSPTLLATMEALGFDVTHLYGLTETFGPTVVSPWYAEWDALPDDQRARLKARQGGPNIVGQPLAVVGPDGELVPRDSETMGEVWLRGNNVTLGYFEDPEQTQSSYAGGWFHTGDLAVWHPDGMIELKDRSKDIIISGGENISSIEVEQVLAGHPDVAEVAVIAGQDDRWGEVPVAFVTVRPGTAPSEQELIDWARGRMTHFKAPKRIVFADLPKTSTGKIEKYALRRRLAEGLAKDDG
ncbi:MAG: AMP-binding protein [Actinomycetota bacterium]|nr:AMP-binding protein [Actinomycetota bacterium]